MKKNSDFNDYLKPYLNPKGSVPQWRKNILIPFVLEREGYTCWVADCYMAASDIHEAIITRGDVQGWKLKDRVKIHTPFNCVALCKEHHKYAPKAEEVFLWMIEEYGMIVVDWFENLEFKGRNPAQFLIERIRNDG